MSRHIHSLTVSNFRAFQSLTVEGLGGVTLITGQNNAGKSTFLESLWLLFTNASPLTLHSILESRDTRPSRASDDPVVCSLFTGYPNLEDCTEPFSFSATDSKGNVRYSISTQIKWSEVSSSEDVLDNKGKEINDFGFRYSPRPHIVIQGKQGHWLLMLEAFNAMGSNPSSLSVKTLLPCIFVGSNGLRNSNHYASLWDNIALTPEEQDLIAALQIISPGILDVRIVGSQDSSTKRTIIVKSKEYKRPVTLGSYGDGVNRLFGLILSLISAKNGVLLVDEIENGFHYSILPKVWETVFTLARRWNVQVFATTHSWDCIESFQKAASNDPEEGVLLRLLRHEGVTYPTVFCEKELEVATRAHIELR
ncbi:MAG: ATP/GTP-binding protein [Candidatus Methylacidiphilales bacterium]|nr:AAA family ATPase [Candidatus Methylacidiphilales bacterium]